MIRSITAIAGALCLGGCVHAWVLEPAPSAPRAPGANVAQESVAGVTVAVSTDRRDGQPWDLNVRYTAVRVKVENHSHRPLAVQYGAFDLATEKGARFSPAAWERGEIEPLPGRGPLYDDERRLDWLEWLGAHDLVKRVLPVGAVPDGATASGYIYFERVPEAPFAVRFEMTLIDAATGQRFGRVELPFLTLRT